jgi:hypothetical protein
VASTREGSGVVLRGWRRRYLIDVWAEPRNLAELPAILRARVKDIATDEECYVGSIAEVEELIEAQLDADGITPRRWEHS